MTGTSIRRHPPARIDRADEIGMAPEDHPAHGRPVLAAHSPRAAAR